MNTGYGTPSLSADQFWQSASGDQTNNQLTHHPLISFWSLSSYLSWSVCICGCPFLRLKRGAVQRALKAVGRENVIGYLEFPILYKVFLNRFNVKPKRFHVRWLGNKWNCFGLTWNRFGFTLYRGFFTGNVLVSLERGSVSLCIASVSFGIRAKGRVVRVIFRDIGS